MDDLTDADLLKAWLAGDQEAYAVLVARHHGLVRTACLRAAPPGEVDDCVQAVFLVLARRGRQAMRAPALVAWLLRTACLVCRCARRSRDNRRRAEAAAAAIPRAASAVRSEAIDHLDECLQRLPERQRVAVAMHYLAGDSPEAVAAALGTNRNNVYQLLNRGLAGLRDLLARRGVAMGSAALVGLLATEAQAAAVPVPVAAITAITTTPPSAGAVTLASGTITAMTLAILIPVAGAAGLLLAATATTVLLTAEPALQRPPAPVAVPALVIDRSLPADDGGGLGMGMFGNRRPPYHDRAVARFGGTVASEHAVRAGLDWLRRQQRPDGRWAGDPTLSDVMLTSQALLAILGSGADPLAADVTLATDWLLVQPEVDDNRERAAVIAALVESYAQASLAAAGESAVRSLGALRDRIQARVDGLSSRQLKHPDGRGGLRGWALHGASGDADLEATVWCTMAFKAAYASGLQVGEGLLGARTHLDEAWRAANDGAGGRPDCRRLLPGMPSVMSERCAIGATAYQPGFGSLDRAPAGLLIAVMTGHRPGDDLTGSLADGALRLRPVDGQAMVWLASGLIQLGGRWWEAWNAEVRDGLITRQRRDGAESGSWDSTSAAGRQLLAAQHCQVLSVYVRYAMVQRQPPALPTPLAAKPPVPAAISASPPAGAWSLPDDPRLEQRMTLGTVQVSVEDYLNSVRQVTGLNITTDRNGQVPVSLRVREMRALDILVWLAIQANARIEVHGADIRLVASASPITEPPAMGSPDDAGIHKELVKPFSLDFQETDIADVHTFLRIVSHCNLVIHPACTTGRGGITLRVKDMPLRDILAWVAKSTNCRVVIRNGAIGILPANLWTSPAPAAGSPPATGF